MRTITKIMEGLTNACNWFIDEVLDRILKIAPFVLLGFVIFSPLLSKAFGENIWRTPKQVKAYRAERAKLKEEHPELYTEEAEETDLLGDIFIKMDPVDEAIKRVTEPVGRFFKQMGDRFKERVFRKNKESGRKGGFTYV